MLIKQDRKSTGENTKTFYQFFSVLVPTDRYGIIKLKSNHSKFLSKKLKFNLPLSFERSLPS